LKSIFTAQSKSICSHFARFKFNFLFLFSCWWQHPEGLARMAWDFPDYVTRLTNLCVFGFAQSTTSRIRLPIAFAPPSLYSYCTFICLTISKVTFGLHCPLFHLIKNECTGRGQSSFPRSPLRLSELVS